MSSIITPPVKQSPWLDMGSDLLALQVVGGLNVAHGLNTQPDMVLARMECLVAYNGYNVGDIVDLNSSVPFGLNTSYGVNFVVDATNINGCMGSLELLMTRRDAVTAIATPPNAWKMQVKAVKF